MQNNMIPLTVANTLDQTTKQRIEAKPNQTLKQAVQAEKLAPQGAFDVYDQLGKVISGNNVANHRDATVYVGVAKVAGGAVPKHRIQELQLEFPSLKPVKQHTSRNGTGMFVLRFPSEGKTTSGFWETVIYCPNASSGNMSGYVLNHAEIVRNPRKAQLSLTAIPGTQRQGKSICHGGIMTMINHTSKDPVKRVNAYINHILNLLNE
ncbi:MAG: hypothetical protein ACPGKR_07335 [Poseidonia sp.]